MAITINTTKMPGRGHLYNDDTKQRKFIITLDNSYPSGGYPCDLSKYTGWRIDDNLSSSFGGWQGEYDSKNKKLLVHRAGVEAPVGTSFYDATLGQYGKLLIWVFQLEEYFDTLGKQPANLLSDPPTIVDAKTLDGVESTQLLRKDTDDAIGTGVTTTIPATSTMKVEGSVSVESGATQTVKSGAIQTIASGASMNASAGSTTTQAGKVVETPITFSAGATPSVSSAKLYLVDGSITPSITNFLNGVENQAISICCIVAGCTITHDPTKISLRSNTNFTMKQYDTILFQRLSGVWVEQIRGPVDGSDVVGSGGTVTIADGATQTNEVGSTVVNSGAVVNVSTAVSSSTPDVAGKSYLSVSSATTASITNFLNGVESQYLLLDCSLGSVTLTQNANISINGNFVMQTLDTITLQYRSGVWYEIQRNVYSGRVGGNLLLLTFNTNIAINATNSNAYSLVTTGNCTLTITGGNPGWTIVLLITDNAIGGHVVTFGSGFRAGGTITGQSNKVCSLMFNYDGVSWFEISRREGL